jgi:hypothetical protein
MTKPVQKPKPPIETLCKTGLAGRCFIVRDERGSTKYQGFVHCIIPSQQGDLVLIQYFEVFFGQLHTMALVPLASMMEKKDRGYVFFEDYEQGYRKVRTPEARELHSIGLAVAAFGGFDAISEIGWSLNDEYVWTAWDGMAGTSDDPRRRLRSRSTTQILR